MSAYKAKRQFPRQVLQEAVRVTSSQGVEFVTIEDVSVGGAKLLFDHEELQGRFMDVEFTLRDDKGVRCSEIRAVGQVAHCVKSPSGFHIGLQFIYTSSDHKKQMERLIDSSEGPF